MKKIILAYFFLFLIVGYNVFGQSTAEKQIPIKTEGLEISYKWKHTNFFSKKSPLMLNVKAKNANDFCVKLYIKVNYYKSGILSEESDTIINCIEPFKSIQGCKYGMNFSAGSFSNAEINSPDFSFEIIPLEIIKMRSCK